MLERTAELRERGPLPQPDVIRSADWYWELNDVGEVTQSSGPIPEILGMVDVASADVSTGDFRGIWDEAGCQALKDNIAARRPFLGFRSPPAARRRLTRAVQGQR